MRITRVYTRTGDRGDTRLAGGQKVSKANPRIVAYGTIDELNSAIGVVRAFNQALQPGGADARFLDSELERIQQRLFDIGGLLATLPKDKPKIKNLPKITPEEIRRLEGKIDECQRELPPLKEFVLPTGSPTTALLHLARTICRRGESQCVALARRAKVEPEILSYLNRLSDLLFVLARWNGRRQRDEESLWRRS